MASKTASAPKPLAWWTFEKPRHSQGPHECISARPARGPCTDRPGQALLDGHASYMISPQSAALLEPVAIPHYDSPIHFRPAKGVLADTIPFFWKGEYHVFYLLGGPAGSLGTHCLQRPGALEGTAHGPWLDPERPNGPDGENMFTGSVTQREGNVPYLLYGLEPATPKGESSSCTPPARI